MTAQSRSRSRHEIWCVQAIWQKAQMLTSAILLSSVLAKRCLVVAGVPTGQRSRQRPPSRTLVL